MGCIRTLFGLTLVIRAAFHCLVAGYAASDLSQLHDITSGFIKQVALKVTHLDAWVKEAELPLVFYCVCGASLLILSCLFPWRQAPSSRLTVYAILHVLYIALVVYLIYVRGLADLSSLREVYSLMSYPHLWPASLVLDVLTFITACVSGGKGRDSDSYTSVFPLHRVNNHGRTPRSGGFGLPSFITVAAATPSPPPYQHFAGADAGAPA